MLTDSFCVESVDSNKVRKTSPCRHCNRIDLVRRPHTAHNAGEMGSHQPGYKNSKLGHRCGLEMSMQTFSASSCGPLHPSALPLSTGDHLDRVGYTGRVGLDH